MLAAAGWSACTRPCIRAGALGYGSISCAHVRSQRGKPVKPYNSVLGEHFRSHWDVPLPSYPSNPAHAPVLHVHTEPSSPSLSAPSSPAIDNTIPRSLAASPAPARSRIGGLLSMRNWSAPAIDERTASSVESISSAQGSKLSLVSARSTASSVPPASALEPVRIAFLTEQVSHHPPVSAYRAECPTRHLTLTGIDQIHAKVTSTMNVRLGPGSLNLGIFVDVGPDAEHGAGERYNVTHPHALVNGLLRGNLWVSMCESTVVTRATGADGPMLRAVIEYKDESWLGRAQFALEGIVHTVEPGDEPALAEWTKVKHVPRERVIAELEGSWRGRVRWRRVGALPGPGERPPSRASAVPANEWHTLLDLAPLQAVPMVVRPLEDQLPNESRRMWNTLTNRLLAKEYSEATKAKVAIEQRQRDDAAVRKAMGIECVLLFLFLLCFVGDEGLIVRRFAPTYFEKDISSGMPLLTAEGRKALDEEIKSAVTAPAPVPEEVQA
jgi:hypothetical protein